MGTCANAENERGAGLKKLRITHLEDGSFKPCTLWRGLKGRVEDLFFERRGGTESACVSVSSDRDVACGYADANSPTLLRFEVRPCCVASTLAAACLQHASVASGVNKRVVVQ
eukprot:2039428-Rhodomonas_salina.4